MKRQDLTYLRTIGESGRRALSALPDAEKPIVEATLKTIQTPNLGESNLVPEDVCIAKLHTHIPLASMKRDDGTEIRSSVTNVAQGRVSINRYFAQGAPAQKLVPGLLKSFSSEEVKNAMNSMIYTSGTVKGFLNRLHLMNSRKCVSIFKDETGVVPAKVSTLQQLLPVGDVPSWNTDDLMDMLEDVTTSKVASAGAPYWRPKAEAMPDVLKYGIPLIVEAVKQGPKAMRTLMAKQPELFIMECKNKTDRYDVDKLGDKTRPYFNTPAHISLLQSALMQPFCKALKQFHEMPRCRNAYGFTLAKGGGSKLWSRMEQALEKNEIFFYAYGDDVDLYVPSKGKLYRVAPDFKQMDYSVDFDTMSLTLDYVYATFKKQHGPNHFWEAFISFWKSLLKRPMIMVQGQAVYTKRADGLMSGVVGTTLFDTVKSVVAYERYAQHLRTTGVDALFDEGKARAFFEKQGLEIKSGTWKPEEVNMKLKPGIIQGNRFVSGDLPSKNKFLGVQLMPVEGPSKVDFVPYLPDEDWLKVLSTPRDDPSQHKKSNTEKLRTHFDRMRGYLVTGAAFSDVVREYCYSEIDRTPAEVILMQTQGDAKGEVEMIVGPDFEFPVSERIPSTKWCFDIYASPDNLFGIDAIPIFEDHVIEEITDQKLIDRRVRIEMKEGVAQMIPDLTEVELPELGAPLKLPGEDRNFDIVPPPPLFNNVIRPTFAQQASEYLQDSVMPVRELASLLSITPTRCLSLLYDQGFYAREAYGEWICSAHPIVWDSESRPYDRLAEQVVERPKFVQSSGNCIVDAYRATWAEKEKKLQEGAPKQPLRNPTRPVVINNRAAEILYEKALPGPPVFQLKELPNYGHAKTIVDRISAATSLKFSAVYKTANVTVGQGSEKTNVGVVTCKCKFNGITHLTVSGPSRSSVIQAAYKRIIEMNDAKIAMLATTMVKTEPAHGYFNGKRLIAPPTSNLESIDEVDPWTDPNLGFGNVDKNCKVEPFGSSWADEQISPMKKAPNSVTLMVNFRGEKVPIVVEEQEGAVIVRSPSDTTGEVARAVLDGRGIRIRKTLIAETREYINKKNEEWKNAKSRYRSKAAQAAKAETPKEAPKETQRCGSEQGHASGSWKNNPKHNGKWKRSAPPYKRGSEQKGSVGTNSANPRNSTQA